MRRSTFVPFFALLAALSLSACSNRWLPPDRTLGDGQQEDCTFGQMDKCKLVPTNRPTGTDVQGQAYNVAPAYDPFSLPWMYGPQVVPLNGPMVGHKVCDHRGLHCTMPNAPGPRGPQWSVFGVFNN